MYENRSNYRRKTMSEEHEGIELEEYYQEVEEYDIMNLFDELTFGEKWARVREGLRAEPGSGEYKWAKLQMLRLLSPISAVVVPVLILLFVMFLATITPPPQTKINVTIMEPEPIEELDDIEEIIEEPPEPPEVVEIEFEPNDVMGINGSESIQGPDADFSPQPAKFDSVAMIRSPVIFKGMYGSRNPGARGQLLGQGGGGNATEGCVLRALRWLKKNQNEDGSWDDKGAPKTGMTAAALLTYLAHGETPASPEFGYTVEGAIRFLIDNQKADGRFNHVDGHEYSHPMAAYALSEAFGLTKVPMVQEAAYKAVKIVVKGQNTKGGWNYNCRGERNDVSYMGWCAQSLKAALLAKVFPTDEEEMLIKACKKAVDGFKANYKKLGDYQGGFGYTGPGVKLTGIGVLCMQLHGASNSEEVRSGLNWIMKNRKVSWDDPKGKTYVWYYCTQAVFQNGGEMWKQWNAQFSPALVQHQTKQSKAESGYVDHQGAPQETGFWDCPAGGHGSGIRVLDTCLSALQLMVYYRYLPTFKAVEAVEQKPIEEIGGKDDIVIEII